MRERINSPVLAPGEYIREELEARGLKQLDLARILGRPIQFVNEMISGKRSITAKTAVELAAAFGTIAQLWLNLESAYQLSKINQKNSVVETKAQPYDAVPVRDKLTPRCD